MLDRLEAIRARFEELGVALTNPEIVSDNKRFSQLSKEYRSLEKIVNAYHDYKDVLDNIVFNREVLNGDDAGDARSRKDSNCLSWKRKKKAWNPRSGRC